MIRWGEPFPFMYDSTAQNNKTHLICKTYKKIWELRIRTILFSDDIFKKSLRLFTKFTTVWYNIGLYNTIDSCTKSENVRRPLQMYIWKSTYICMEKNLDINTSLGMMDFEIANIDMNQILISNAQVKGWLLHFSQSLWQKKYLLWI